MEEQLVSFKTALLAKEKKFDIPTLYCYEWVKNHEVTVCKNEQNIGSLDNWNDHTGEENGYNLIFYSAPTQSLLQKWLREKHNIHISILHCILSSNEIKYFIFKGTLKWNWGLVYNTYEEALEEALYQALVLIK